jgi:hypothetical protein
MIAGDVVETVTVLQQHRTLWMISYLGIIYSTHQARRICLKMFLNSPTGHNITET